MKKKLVIYSIVLVIILFAFIYFKYIFGWLEFKSNNYTEKQYQSLVHVSKDMYSKDSLNLISTIKDRINRHKDPYNDAIRMNGKQTFINDTLTKVHIDSIFYSPNLNRIAFLVIVENDNKKLYSNMTKEEADNLEKQGNLPYEGTHFDGISFIAERNNGIFNVFPFGNSFTNSKSYKENSAFLRDACLNNREKKDKKVTYNFDDKRFWNSEDWSLIK